MQSALLSPGAMARLTGFALLALFLSAKLQAGEPSATEPSWLSTWWNGKYATGNWLGLRDSLEDHGLKIKGKWTGVYYGLVDGGVADMPGSYFDQQLKFSASLDFQKALHLDALEGLKAFGEARFRDGDDPNSGVGASFNFDPSHLQTGLGWRLMNLGLLYTTPKLFGIEKFATLTVGWLEPQDEFLDQPLSKLFVNNSFESSKGIGANLPFASSWSTWGATLRVNPADWYYAKAGLFLAYPELKGKHDFPYRGYSSKKIDDGLFGAVETGFTPEIGPSRLPGKYAAGAYVFGDWNNSFYNYRSLGQYGFYWQADQMLWREPRSLKSSRAHSEVEGVSFEDPYIDRHDYSKQGLYAFSLLAFSPPYNNIVPFYFQTGLVYQGLIPTRDEDRLMAGFSFATYSINDIHHLQNDEDVTDQPNYSAAMEFDYRFQLNRWAYVQPYIQYIIRPNGAGSAENATIIGFETGIYF